MAAQSRVEISSTNLEWAQVHHCGLSLSPQTHQPTIIKVLSLTREYMHMLSHCPLAQHTASGY